MSNHSMQARLMPEHPLISHVVGAFPKLGRLYDAGGMQSWTTWLCADALRWLSGGHAKMQREQQPLQPNKSRSLQLQGSLKNSSKSTARSNVSTGAPTIELTSVLFQLHSWRFDAVICISTNDVWTHLMLSSCHLMFSPKYTFSCPQPCFTPSCASLPDCQAQHIEQSQ